MNAVTLKFVAQSGHVWEEEVNADDIDSTVEQTVATHGDIERVEKLSDPNDMSGETIWRFESRQESIVLQPIHLGQGPQGQRRREALEAMAAEEGHFWNGKPSIGRWLVAKADKASGQ